MRPGHRSFGEPAESLGVLLRHVYYLVLKAVTVETYLASMKCKCGSQFCPLCSLAHCVRWRERLRPAISRWKFVMMLTLTVDQDSEVPLKWSRYKSPRHAYESIGQKRRVAEMVKALHRDNWLRSRHFVNVIELQKNGWPHYHVLVESDYVPHAELSRRWGQGHVWFSKRDFEDSSHAVNYVTKYITKTSKDEDEFWFPDWVLDYPGNFRRFSTSRGLCPPIRKGKNKRSEPKGGTRIRKSGRQRATQ